MRPVELIVLHCSAGKYGTMATLREFHTMALPLGRGWKDVAYHRSVRNGWDAKGLYVASHVGLVEMGRDLDHDGDVDEEIGAHAEGFNSTSIGVCLIGPPIYDEQIAKAVELVASLCTEFHLDPALPASGFVARQAKKLGLPPPLQVSGHREIPDVHRPGLYVPKECPTIDMDRFRAAVAAHIQ